MCSKALTHTHLEVWKLKWFFSIFACMISKSSRLCRLPDRFFPCFLSRWSFLECLWNRGRGGGGTRAGGGLRSAEQEDLDETSSTGDNLLRCSTSLSSSHCGSVVAVLCIVCSCRRRLLNSLLSRLLRWHALSSSGMTVRRTCIVFEP